METGPQNPDTNLPADFYMRQINALMHMRAEHITALEKIGLVSKAREALPRHTTVHLAGALVEPTIYARPVRVYTDKGYTPDPITTEEGICFRVTKVNLAGRIQYEKIHAPVSFVEDGIVFPRTAQGAQFSDEEAAVVHAFAEALKTAKSEGVLPSLSLDCTEIQDGSYYEG